VGGPQRNRKGQEKGSRGIGAKKEMNSKAVEEATD